MKASPCDISRFSCAPWLLALDYELTLCSPPAPSSTANATLMEPQTLLKISDNILSNTDEPKFRDIKATNPSLQNKVLSVKGGHEYMIAVSHVAPLQKALSCSASPAPAKVGEVTDSLPQLGFRIVTQEFVKHYVLNLSLKRMHEMVIGAEVLQTHVSLPSHSIPLIHARPDNHSTLVDVHLLSSLTLCPAHQPPIPSVRRSNLQGKPPVRRIGTQSPRIGRVRSGQRCCQDANREGEVESAVQGTSGERKGTEASGKGGRGGTKGAGWFYCDNDRARGRRTGDARQGRDHGRG